MLTSQSTLQIIPMACPKCGSDLQLSTIVVGAILLVCLAEHGIVFEQKRAEPTVTTFLMAHPILRSLTEAQLAA